MTEPPGHRFAVRGDVPVLEFPLFDGLPVDVVVTERRGGRSAGPYATLNLALHVGDDPRTVVANREVAAGALGLGLDDLVFADQVHGTAAVEVGRADRGRGARAQADAVGPADVVTTADRGTGLVVMVADCLPIVLHDPVRGALAVVHAGWRGTVAGAAGAGVAALVEGGSRPADLRAAVGPAISAAAYQVGDEVAAAARAAFGDAAAEHLVADGSGRWRFDLVGANVGALMTAGIPRSQVAVAGVVTDGGAVFFSDRAARPCGRFALLAVLR